MTPSDVPSTLETAKIIDQYQIFRCQDRRGGFAHPRLEGLKANKAQGDGE
jgi:hypothetical protein